MNLIELKISALNHMKKGIVQVIEGKIEEYSNDLVSIGDVERFLKKLPEAKQEDFEENGWQSDYWVYWIINNEKYCIRGSGWYGEITFSKEDEVGVEAVEI